MALTTLCQESLEKLSVVSKSNRRKEPTEKIERDLGGAGTLREQ
jgi:hypothetical protein